MEPQHMKIEASASWKGYRANGETSSPQRIVIHETDNNGFGDINSKPSFIAEVLMHNESLPSFSSSPSNEPDFAFMRKLILILLLTTSLAWFSALDAKNHCRSREAYDVYEEFTEEGETSYISFWGRAHQRKSCLQMFRLVMIPSCGLTLLAGLLSLLVIRKRLDKSLAKIKQHRQNLYKCYVLSALMPIMALAWSYGIVAIMLAPRTTKDDNEENPYRSLAAVDDMGQIGQNANLYYLSWASFGLSISAMYQICVDTVRQARRLRQERLAEQEHTTTPDALHVGDIEAMLSSSNETHLDNYRESRATWYQSLYRLRIRTGIWTATLLAASIVLQSSLHIWRVILIPTAKNLYGNNVKLGNVCRTLRDSGEVEPQLCGRTAFSLVSGVMGVLLCITAIGIHLFTRQGAAIHVDRHERSALSAVNRRQKFTGTHIPLRSELMLAVILANLLGLNAVFATGVQGPAANVGNLYYASWLSFLLCLRIGLGCLEELCNINWEEKSMPNLAQGDGLYRAPGNETDDDDSKVSSQKSEDAPSEKFSIVPEHQATDLSATDRAIKTRKYLLLCIFSTVCSASAFDAACNQDYVLDSAQTYVIYAPSMIAVLCAFQFLLCLRARTYQLISQMWLGGLVSIATFGVCLVSLVLTMHSESSWAVNAIGEIRNANLYYFSWGSIVTAGLQMAYYFKTWLGVKQDDFISVAWAAVYKVALVLLAAGYHVWHAISDTCSSSDTYRYIETGAFAFCSRTIFVMVVACTSIFVAGCVVCTRLLLALCRSDFSPTIRAHVEMLVSLFLFFLYGAAVAIITGIGGPGQTVGDAYYSTWLNFFVSIGLAIMCYGEIRKEQYAAEVGNETADSSAHGDDEGIEMERQAGTEFVRMT